MSRCHSLLIGVLAVSLLLAGRLSAATVTWDGDTSSDFEAGANWVGNSAPANNITADTATFGTIGTSTQPALSTSRSVLGTNFTGVGWTLSGPHTLTLGSGGIDSTGSGTNSVTNSGLILGANSTWTVGADNRLSVNSNVSGTGSLTKDGAGELLLAGANTHTGATQIAAGTLTLAADNALSASSHLTLGSSGTLRLNGHGATLYGVNGDTSTAGSAIVNGVSTDPVTLTLSCESGNFSYYRGSIGRSGGSAEDNAIAVVAPAFSSALTVRWLMATNYYTGGTTVNGNSMASQAVGALGTGPVTINGGGRLVAIGAGTLNSSATGNPALDVTVNAGGTLDFRNDSSTLTRNVGGRIKVAGNAVFQSSGGGPGVAGGTLAIGSHTLTHSNSGAPTLILGATTLTGSPTFNVPGSTSTLQLGAVSGGYGFAKVGAGTLVLTGDSTYSGATNVSAGTMAINGSKAGSGSITVANGATLTANGGVAGNVTVEAGAFLKGTGTYSGLVTMRGTLIPGDAPGTQTFCDGLAYTSTSTLLWDLTTNSIDGAGLNYDQILVTGGHLSIDTGAALSLVFGGDVQFANPFWDTAHTWTLIDYSGDGASTGSFTSLSSNVFYASQGAFSVSNADGDIQLTWTPSVPEPSSASMAVLASMAAAAWRTRKSRGVTRARRRESPGWNSSR